MQQLVFTANDEDTIPWSLSKLKKVKEPENWQALVNWFSYKEFTEIFRKHLTDLFCPSWMDGNCRWGFKEIRYGKLVDDRTIEFLSTIFPEALFLFISRNGFNTVASQLKQVGETFSKGAVILRCRRRFLQNSLFWEWHHSGKIRSFLIRFEDLIEEKLVLDDFF